MKTIVKYFILWRVFLFLILVSALLTIPLRLNFLGGGINEYLKNPIQWSGLNFDGEHFLSIAYKGYQPLTYFFFPLYPILIKHIANIFGDGSYQSLVSTGLIVSNLCFVLSLLAIQKLMKLEGIKNIKLLLLIILTFPLSFIFASYYSESLFLFLSVWFFYFLRKKRWIVSAIFAMLAITTRLVGISLIASYLVEIYLKRKDGDIRGIGIWLGLMIIPVGLIFYLLFVYQNTGDALNFFNSVSIYGQQRSNDIILLPQVFYRYFFKIIPSINYNYFPVVFTTLLELITGKMFLLLSIYGFFKLRLSYAVFLFLGYLIPTLSGSFSSLPRYVIVLFPAYFLILILLKKMSPKIRVLYLLISSILLIISFSLFSRGYFVS